MSLKSKIIKEGIWAFLTKGVTFILFFLLNILLARKLGVEKFGTWSFYLSIITVVFLFSYFGVNSSARVYIARYNKTEHLKKILLDSTKIRIFFSLFFSLFFLLIAKPLADLLGRPDFAKLFIFSIPLIFFSALTEFLKEVFIGLHRIKYNFVVNFFEYGLKLLLVFIYFLFSVEVFSVIASYTIALLITSFVGFALLYFYFYRDLDFSGKNFKNEILKYSLPLFFIGISFMLSAQIDIIMLGFLLDKDEQIGIFAVANQIALKLPQIALALSIATMPLFAKKNNENNAKLKKLFYKLLKLNTVVFGLIAVGIFLFANFFIVLLFGQEYQESALILKILTPYLVMYSFSMFISSFLDYQGFAKKRAINLSIAVILNICLNYLLIPIYGGVGAAIATSVSYFPYIVLNWREVKKNL